MSNIHLLVFFLLHNFFMLMLLNHGLCRWFKKYFLSIFFFLFNPTRCDANFAENCVLLGIALNSNITELKENQVLSLLFSQRHLLAVIEYFFDTNHHCDQAVFTVVLLGFHLVGLILKCVYYRYRLLISHLFSHIEHIDVQLLTTQTEKAPSVTR